MSVHDKVCYVIITPVRDEAQYIEKTIGSVVSQTVLPVEWVIVDDGSTDSTGEIITSYAKRHSWISPVRRSDRGFRKSASGVMEAFYEGWRHLRAQEWEFVVKLDGDLSFEPAYFEQCFAEFKSDPNLGIGGGVIHTVQGKVRTAEEAPAFHVRGATKIYRRDCWKVIGGLLEAPGWDTVDELKANMLGWHTRSFPQLVALQHRATGAADGTWRDAVKNGRADYVSAYHPLFMIVKCLKRCFQKPFLVNALGHAWGYAGGYLQKTPRVQDADLIRYVHDQQLRRLRLLDSIWK